MELPPDVAIKDGREGAVDGFVTRIEIVLIVPGR
jgi:hypothetical protein